MKGAKILSKEPFRYFTGDLFKDGGLFLGPTHAIQVDTPLDNILEMYRIAGGLSGE
jgi:hypothetical protein